MMSSTQPATSRRRFLKQTFAFSALASLGLDLPAFAAPAHPGVADLLFIGDWGYDTDHTGQTAVATGMAAYARQNALRPQALLLLGDNWYGDLTGGVHSPRWKSQFEQMYPSDLFNCPAYAILGNHDYQNYPESKVEAELEYARQPNTRWTMPARWYRFDFPTHKPLITFIALDSNMPHPSGPQAAGRNFTLTEEQRTAQLAWLEHELQKPRTTPFLAVLGHHPVYSDGPHGDHPVLTRDWDPLFRKYNVQLYLAGHDHDLQHLEFEGHPTTFFLSGGGGADLYDLKVNPSQRGPYAQKIYGFSHLSASSDALTLRHLDSQGRVVHAITKSAKGAVSVLQV
ncbi:MAG TPA: metallophosphoesterase [Terracidiphilus sp.]|jgi:tartrate-resistant acid phosphatase type 5|nr:metallophosphoesterase [Terracidiphilus sp.]